MTDPSARRRLGLTSAVAIVISSMIGAGVFTTSGFALADLGSRSLVLLAWLVAGLIAVCGAIGYGALAREFRESGGEYLFLSRALHPAAGFLAGCVSLLAGFTGAIAFAATALEAYLVLPKGSSSPLGWLAECPPGTSAVLVIAVATGLHLFRVEMGSRVQNGLIVAKFGMLLLILLIAGRSFPDHWPGWNETLPETSFSLANFCMSLVWISLSYCGFNAAVYIAGEVKSAEITVPRALIGGTCGVGVCYLLLNFVFLYVPAAAAISGQQEVALTTANALRVPWLHELVRLLVVLSLFTSVSVMIMTGPRVYAQMAEDGLFPGWLKFQGPVPRAAILLQGGLAALVVWVSTLKQLLSYLGFTLSLSAALTVASLFWLPGSRGRWYVKPAAAVFVIATVGIALLAASRAPLESSLALATLLGGLVLYLVIDRVKTSHGNHSPKS